MADLSAGATLRQLLPERFDALPKAARDAIRAEGAAWPRMAWGPVGDAVGSALGSALDVDLLGILAQGWVQAKQLHGYRDPKKHPATETAVLPLATHDLACAVHPVVRVAAPPVLPGLDLRFTVEVTAAVEAVSLTIIAGRIVAVGAGKCTVSASLHYGAVELYRHPDVKTLHFPGNHRLAAPGVAIP